jgi:hypothetical protein
MPALLLPDAEAGQIVIDLLGLGLALGNLQSTDD